MQTFKELTQGGGKTWVTQLKGGGSTPHLGKNFDFVQHHHQKTYSETQVTIHIKINN